MPVTIVAEDGSADPDANSYVTEVEADSYHEQRGNVYWNLLDTDQRRTCLIRATDFIDKRFGQRFRGYRMQKDQALSWPRLSAFDDDEYSIDGVPAKLKKATAEYALRAAIYNVLAPDPNRAVVSQDMSSQTPNSTSQDIVVGTVKLLTQKVGPLEKTVEYDNKQQQLSSRSTQSNVVNDFYVPQYPEADLLIEHLLLAQGQITLERA